MKSKSITTIIFSIIGIIFIAIAVYAAAVKKTDSDSEKYKGWTLYENPEAGFSLMRLKSFVVYEDKIEHPGENEYPKQIIFASKPRPERPDGNIDTYVAPGGYAFVIDSGKNPLELTLEKWLHPITLEEIKQQENHEIKVAGQKAFIAVLSSGEFDGMDTYFVTKDKYFHIRLIPFIPKKLSNKYPDYKDSVKNLHLMLESFKLLEKSE